MTLLQCIFHNHRLVFQNILDSDIDFVSPFYFNFEYAYT